MIAKLLFQKQENKNETELSETQHLLLEGLQLLPLEKDNIIMVMLMLKSSEEKQRKMLFWIAARLKMEKIPSQPQVMDKALQIMQEQIE